MPLLYSQLIKVFPSAEIAIESAASVAGSKMGFHVAPEFVERKNGLLFIMDPNGTVPGKFLAAKTFVPSADTAKEYKEFVIGNAVGFQVAPELVEI